MSQPVIIVDEALVDYYARKFFPHLQPAYGRLCVLAVLVPQRISAASNCGK